MDWRLMKLLALVIAVGLLSSVVSKSAEPNQIPLKEVPLDLRSLESGQIHKYKWVTVTRTGTNTESEDYASLVISSKLTNKKLEFHDTITMGASYHGMIFDRGLVFPQGKLFTPERIIIDITFGPQTVRQLDYKNGEATWIEFSGGTNTERRSFDDGILTFNTLLRIAPLLPRETGSVYTFQAYAEPFLFRIHEPEKKDGPFTLACEGPQTVTMGKKSYECVKFRLEMKSVQIRTDLWVGTKNNLVVKFVDTLPEGVDAYTLEAMPEGAEPGTLEATLQE